MTDATESELLINDLHKLGICEGDTLFVHASFKSLGMKEGDAETVVSALLAVLGDRGTLLMPALSYSTVTENDPVFHIDNTPACVGAIPEYFRTRRGTIRSMHPTHSVCACGYYAEQITRYHILDRTPVGQHSPFSLLQYYDGKILMLGCGLRPNTSMHGIEELVIPPYLFKEKKTRYTLIDSDGNSTQAEYIAHNFNGYEQRYDRIEGLLNDQELKKGKVLSADCSLIDARALWRKAYRKYCENPLYFVDCKEAVPKP